MATYLRLEDLPVQEIIPGFHGRLVHTERVTLAHWDIAAGSVLPEHHHFHEQITRVMAGTFELICAGETRQVTAGDIAVIPANEPHSGRALTDCVLIELFQPARDEYRL